RQKVGEQAAIEQIDGDGAAADIGAAYLFVPREHQLAAIVLTGAMRLAGELGNGRGVAQAQVQALRADRRHDMRRLADQNDAVARKRTRRHDAEREEAAARLDRHLAEYGMDRMLDGEREFGVVE